ncbi:hypothetical protein [Rhizohabitans arisaemae]|uniref:hypothetical protein n=1 Tax=Rhizohabitans arisaemae TaxID=2720610 RepID=UPI0024B096AB|nr:hypothetical protein [Rhizohabitans arisaemae]
MLGKILLHREHKARFIDRRIRIHERRTVVTPAGLPQNPVRSSSRANIRRIYGPEKEALGALAIEIELVDQPTG